MKWLWSLIAFVTFIFVVYLFLKWLGMWDTVAPSIKEAVDNGWKAIQNIFKEAFR